MDRGRRPSRAGPPFEHRRRGFDPSDGTHAVGVWSAHGANDMSADGRYSRNEELFGAEGQAKIARTKVTIVGLGGLGSQVGQQLVYLGVRSFALIDFDIVTDSSLNR